MNDKLIFFKTNIKDKKVASIYPSSKFLIKKICNKINFNNEITIIEYGPGTGAITKELLKKMNKNSMLVAIVLQFNFSVENRKI